MTDAVILLFPFRGRASAEGSAGCTDRSGRREVWLLQAQAKGDEPPSPDLDSGISVRMVLAAPEDFPDLDDVAPGMSIEL